MKSAELTPTAQKIDRIIKRIDEGDIKIPAFQRGFVWKQNQVIELMESIVADYPIGSVLLWKTDERLKCSRNIAGYKIPERDDAYPVNYALDGQQRMASIYGVFSQLTEQECDGSGYNPNTDIFEIYYDFEDEHFVDAASVRKSEVSIHLRKLLDLTTLFDAVKSLEEQYHKKAQELASKFLNYEIPVVTIENRSRDDVGIIFERINNTGTKLSALDLMTAWTWTDDFHLLEASNALLDELNEKGFGKVKHKTLLQVISAIIQNTTVTKRIIQLDGAVVRDNWLRVEDKLRKAIDFLATDLRCPSLDFLPFNQQMIPIVKFFDVIDRPTAEQLKALRQYFWKTSFSNRYITGQSNWKMDADIECIYRLSKGEDDAFSEYSYTLTASDFKKSRFSKANATTRAFLLLLAQSTPKNLVNGQAIDLGQALAQYNRKEYHHVFPQAFLKKRDTSVEKINSVLNFCFLPSDSNKLISTKAPSDYFFSIVPRADFQEILSCNLLPTNADIYKDDNFDDFLERRSFEVLRRLDAVINA